LAQVIALAGRMKRGSFAELPLTGRTVLAIADSSRGRVRAAFEEVSEEVLEGTACPERSEG
jgi:hypothetical protein